MILESWLEPLMVMGIIAGAGLVFFLCVFSALLFYKRAVETTEEIRADSKIQEARIHAESRQSIAHSEAITDIKLAQMEGSGEEDEGAALIQMLFQMKNKNALPAGVDESEDPPAGIPPDVMDMLKTHDGRMVLIEKIKELDK